MPGNKQKLMKQNKPKRKFHKKTENFKKSRNNDRDSLALFADISKKLQKKLIPHHVLKISSSKKTFFSQIFTNLS